MYARPHRWFFKDHCHPKAAINQAVVSSTSAVNRQGNIVARRTPALVGAANTAVFTAPLWQQAVRRYGLTPILSFAVHMGILPKLRIAIKADLPSCSSEASLNTYGLNSPRPVSDAGPIADHFRQARHLSVYRTSETLAVRQKG
jgi:hypothetical protein